MESKVGFILPAQPKAYTLEAIWGSCLVFCCISLKDLIWFFTALMLERKLIFLSKNLHLLTATLSVIRSLTKPFKYPFPLIFNLPELLMVMCDAPGAALIGINKTEEYLKAEGLFENYSSGIYVCLDEGKIYMEPDNNIVLPHFDNMEKSLMKNYAKLNANLNYQIVQIGKKSNMKPVARRERDMKYSASVEQKNDCMCVLETFKETLEKKILRYVPSEPIFKEKKQLDYDKIEDIILHKSDKADHPFMKQFLQTQIFTYYLEQHYELDLKD